MKKIKTNSNPLPFDSFLNDRYETECKQTIQEIARRKEKERVSNRGIFQGLFISDWKRIFECSRASCELLLPRYSSEIIPEEKKIRASLLSPPLVLRVRQCYYNHSRLHVLSERFSMQTKLSLF